MTACGGGGNSSTPPPPPVTVTVTPATASVNAGLTVQFTAAVANSTNTAVTWAVTGGAANGTISASGLYTAPATPPSGAVTVTATSQADTSASGSASITVKPAITVTVSPATATVNAGLTQQFTATVANTTKTAVTWAVIGGAADGTISATGLYTAPATPPSGAVTVTAASQADASIVGSAKVTVAPAIAVSVNPAAPSVYAGQTQQFTASVANTTNGNVTWSVTGGAANGTVSAAGLYTAPATPPAGGSATVVAESQADSSATGSAHVSIEPAITVTVTGASSSVNAGLTDQFSATVGPSGISQSVTWQVNGTTGGDTADGTISTSGLYQSPSAPPASGTVTITATSATGSVVSPAYSLTIAPAITVSIAAQGTPPSVLVAGTSETFAATVANTTNQNVNWQVNGVPGGNATLGVITTAGVYTAPKLLPPGGGVTITATAQADPNASSSGISITDGWANGSLQGTYVFAVQGTDGAGCTFDEVGQFTADGATNAQGDGNITGEADFNTTTANGCPGTDVAATAGNLTGTYQIAPNGTGGIQFTTSPEGSSMVYAIVLDASGNARLIEQDASASVTGSVWTQSSTAAPSGAYVFGVAPDQIGLITAASNAWTGTEDIDINNAGTVTTDASVTGTFTNPDASGRAAMTLIEGATTENYVYYAVSASRFELMRSDGGIVAIGRADAQASGVNFSLSLLSGNYVFQDAGTQALSPGTAFSAAGQFTADGSGNIPAGAGLDVRSGTSNQSGQVLPAGSYTASASADGEYTVTLSVHTYYIWMYSATGGEILQADGQGNAQGTVAQQQNGPFGNNALYGEYALQMTGGTGTGGATTVVLQGELAALNGVLAGQGDSVVGGTVNNGASGGALYLVGTYNLEPSGEATGTLMACSGTVAPTSAACPTGDTQVFTTTLDFWIGTAGKSSAGTTASGRAFLTAAPGGTYWQGTLTQQY